MLPPGRGRENIRSFDRSASIGGAAEVVLRITTRAAAQGGGEDDSADAARIRHHPLNNFLPSPTELAELNFCTPGPGEGGGLFRPAAAGRLLLPSLGSFSGVCGGIGLHPSDKNVGFDLGEEHREKAEMLAYSPSGAVGSARGE